MFLSQKGYNNFINEVLLNKKKFTEDMEKLGWNFTEKTTETDNYHTHILVNNHFACVITYHRESQEIEWEHHSMSLLKDIMRLHNDLQD
jgi:hypothetical protein